jgi:hypothetical protein
MFIFKSTNQDLWALTERRKVIVLYRKSKLYIIVFINVYEYLLQEIHIAGVDLPLEWK